MNEAVIARPLEGPRLEIFDEGPAPPQAATRGEAQDLASRGPCLACGGAAKNERGPLGGAVTPNRIMAPTLHDVRPWRLWRRACKADTEGCLRGLSHFQEVGDYGSRDYIYQGYRREDSDAVTFSTIVKLRFGCLSILNLQYMDDEIDPEEPSQASTWAPAGLCDHK